MPRQPIDLSQEEISALYVAGFSTVALARQFHCSPTTIAALLHKRGVTMRRARFDTVLVPEVALREQYEVQRLPLGQIARNFGVSLSTIKNRRHLYGISSRNRKNPE